MTRLCELKARKFFKCIAGAATVEFVMALPIMLAMLAFAVQYGNAIKVRNNLDVASRDAARYLARAPLNAASTDVDVYFKDKAQDLIEDRLVGTKATIANFTPTSNATQATVNVTIDVPFPLLKFIGLLSTADATIAISAAESWSRTGDTVSTSSTSGGGS